MEESYGYTGFSGEIKSGLSHVFIAAFIFRKKKALSAAFQPSPCSARSSKLDETQDQTTCQLLYSILFQKKNYTLVIFPKKSDKFKWAGPNLCQPGSGPQTLITTEAVHTHISLYPSSKRIYLSCSSRFSSLYQFLQHSSSSISHILY